MKWYIHGAIVSLFVLSVTAASAALIARYSLDDSNAGTGTVTVVDSVGGFNGVRTAGTNDTVNK
jgi:hypothetical protein